jgi:hypothetical protein
MHGTRYADLNLSDRASGILRMNNAHARDYGRTRLQMSRSHRIFVSTMQHDPSAISVCPLYFLDIMVAF